MSYTTYSFQDVVAAFACPSVGSASSTGAGLGSITVDMTTEKTVHEVAADGKVMVSKIPGENGTIAVVVQQTSALHKYLLNWYNYINNSSSAISAWASMAITISSANLGDKTICTGVSPQKLAGRAYAAQGASVTWTLMAAEITES
ncbi:phage protein [Clostridium estertheticum]|uniref:phage protein n=1 Tax=Clostridium estertheticum TaxID=238834 RepID=UPI001C7DEF0C|nr:phage protein [Clostridium estertheticum]MBX4266538.1 DUF3277 family protein [Clostridium estertheticum]WLC88122.1 DUF3277 family protein [Clostridium estertheticum]